MYPIVRASRFYFWPIIAINTVAMAAAVRGEIFDAFVLSMSISCLASFGFLINDLWDRAIDRVNAADHFEDSDPPTLRRGVRAAILFFCMGITCALPVGFQAVGVAVTVGTGLAAYTFWLRPVLYIPTMVVAALAASPLWAPLLLWPTSATRAHWSLVAAFALIIAARETLMDCRDRKGDEIGGRTTVAIRFGPRTAKSFAVYLSLVATALLALVLWSRLPSLSTGFAVFGAVLIVFILSLVVQTALKTVSAGDDDREAIQSYVLASRFAMLFAPALTLVLW